MKFNPFSFFKDFKTFFPMAWDVLKGRYPMPWATLFWAVLCLVYVISPIDILPDVMPLLGITDDGAFLLLILALVHKDLQTYRQKKNTPKQVLDAEVVPPSKTDKK